MVRPRQLKAHRAHLALMVNKAAAGYEARTVNNLIAAIREQGHACTVYEPESAVDMMKQAEVAAGIRRANSAYLPPHEQGGKITALVACGGDGTFNLVARAGLQVGLPVGCLPLGRMNNIARHFYGSAAAAPAIRAIVSGAYKQVDTGTAADIPFFCAAAVGFLPHLALHLQGKSTPRFGLGWSQLGAKAAAEVPQIRTSIKVDAFRFDVRPLTISVHLLSHAVGLPFCPAALTTDGQMELVFDTGDKSGYFSNYTRLTHKRMFLYGDELRLYRGKAITIQPLRGRRLYLDGELIDIPNENLEVKVSETQLGVFQ